MFDHGVILFAGTSGMFDHSVILRRFWIGGGVSGRIQVDGSESQNQDFSAVERLILADAAIGKDGGVVSLIKDHERSRIELQPFEVAPELA